MSLLALVDLKCSMLILIVYVYMYIRRHLCLILQVYICIFSVCIFIYITYFNMYITFILYVCKYVCLHFPHGFSIYK